MGLGDRVRFAIEYLAARLLFGALGRTPAALGRPLGRALGRAVGLLRPRQSRVGVDNWTAAFPGTSPEEARRRVGGVWAHFGEWFWEYARLGRGSPADYADAIALTGLEGLRDSVKKGKGVLLFTGHLGNWEYATPFMSLDGMPLAMIARRAKNPWVNDFITRVRERFGARVFMHKNAARESLRWLREGKVLGLLFDQRITDGALAVPFFGRPALTTGLPALLALRLGCAVHPMRSWREGKKIRVDVEPAMEIPAGGPTPENMFELTRRMTERVEAWVRAAPDQWLWIHNRWKP